MRTHNIGFYEDLAKIIFELSSNIIKYAPFIIYKVVKYWKILLIYIVYFIFSLVKYKNLYFHSTGMYI